MKSFIKTEKTSKYYLFLVCCIYIITTPGCDVYKIDTDITGTWLIDLTYKNGESKKVSYSTVMADTKIEYKKYWRITDDTLYYIYEIITDIPQDKSIEISESWYEQFGNYLNSDLISFTSVSIDINGDSLWIEDKSENFTIDNKTLKIGTSTNYNQLRKSDRNFDNAISDFIPVSKHSNPQELKLDTPLSVLVDSEGFAYMFIQLEAGNTYYFSSQDSASSMFKINYTLSQDYIDITPMNTLYNYDVSYPAVYFIPDTTGVYYLKLSDANSAFKNITIEASRNEPQPPTEILAINSSAKIEYDINSDFYYFEALLEKNRKYYIYNYDAYHIKVKDPSNQDVQLLPSIINLTECKNHPYYIIPEETGYYIIKLSLSSAEDATFYGLSSDVDISLSRNNPDQSQDYNLSNPIEVPTSKRLVLKTLLDQSNVYYFYTRLAGFGSGFISYVYEGIELNHPIYSYNYFSFSNKISIPVNNYFHYVIHDTDSADANIKSYIVIEFESHIDNDTFTISNNSPHPNITQ